MTILVIVLVCLLCVILWDFLARNVRIRFCNNMEFIPVIIYLSHKLIQAVFILAGFSTAWFVFGLRSRYRFARRYMLPYLRAEIDRLRLQVAVPAVAK